MRLGTIALALVLLAASVAADAQEYKAGKVHRIGLLLIAERERSVHFVKAFEERLRELGYVEGRNVVSEYRFAGSQRARLPDLAAELVRLKVDVIVTSTDTVTMAARQATTTIPIVMAIWQDPVGLGLIASLRRPGGNVTGLTTTAAPGMFGKHLELLKEIVPSVSRVACLWNPDIPSNAPTWGRTEEAARKMGVTLLSVEVRALGEIESAFARIKREGAQAAIVIPDALALSPLRGEIRALAAKNRLPAIHMFRETVEAGGLMS